MPEQLTVAERQGVVDLIAEYAHALESGNLDGYVETFAPGGTFEAGGERYEGHEEIRDLVAHLYAIGQDGPGGNRHILGIPYIIGTPEGCAARTYVLIASGANRPGAAIQAIGQYHDRIALSGGRWRFVHRRIERVSNATARL